jgi:hypothetical protein
MSKLRIDDLDFCQTEPPNLEPIQGSGDSTRGLWTWDIKFDFDWDDDGISGWSVGHFSVWGLAIGGIVIQV